MRRTMTHSSVRWLWSSAVEGSYTPRRAGRNEPRSLPDAPSLLEQILEPLDGVARPSGARGNVALDGRSQCVERAFVPRRLVRDRGIDGTGALEAAARIEVGALRAGVKLRPAFGAGTGGLSGRRQQRSALRAPRHRPGAGHLQRLRSD